MANDGITANPIEKKEVSSEMAFPKRPEINHAPSEPMFAKRLRQLCTGDQQVEDVFERVVVEFGMLASRSVIPLEAREDDQLSSQRMASRPLRKRRPLPRASSFIDSRSDARSCADERFGLACVIHAFSAASALV
jgi:hypothetical protein